MNQFQAAGGPGFVIRELLDAGFMRRRGHRWPRAAWRPTAPAGAGGAALRWSALPGKSGDASVLRSAAEPFSAEGGLKLLTGNLGTLGDQGVGGAGRPPRDRGAGARIFESQESLLAAFKPANWSATSSPWCASRARANGMPGCTS